MKVLLGLSLVMLVATAVLAGTQCHKCSYTRGVNVGALGNPRLSLALDSMTANDNAACNGMGTPPGSGQVCDGDAPCVILRYTTDIKITNEDGSVETGSIGDRLERLCAPASLAGMSEGCSDITGSQDVRDAFIAQLRSVLSDVSDADGDYTGSIEVSNFSGYYCQTTGDNTNSYPPLPLGMPIWG